MRNRRDPKPDDNAQRAHFTELISARPHRDVFQKSILPVREHTRVECFSRRHSHPFQRQAVRDQGYDQSAIALKADKSAVEQMADARREQQSVLSVEPLFVVAVSPRFTMA